MEEPLGRETQLNAAQLVTQEVSVPQAVAAPADDSTMSPEVEALIARCMDGTEPVEGNTDPRLLKKFSTRHVQVVMLRVAGFKQNEIAHMVSMEPAWISVTLAHPYSKKIIRALIPESATKVIDIRTRMELYAGELMDHAYNLAIKSEEIKEVREITFGLLDRAGYNVVTKNASAVVQPKDLETAGDAMMKRLHSALDESLSIDKSVMPNWSTPVPPDDSHLLPDPLADTPVPASEWDPARPEDVQPRGSSTPSSGGSQRTGTDN